MIRQSHKENVHVQIENYLQKLRSARAIAPPCLSCILTLPKFPLGCSSFQCDRGFFDLIVRMSSFAHLHRLGWFLGVVKIFFMNI